jgi:hypothetical protein
MHVCSGPHLNPRPQFAVAASALQGFASRIQSSYKYQSTAKIQPTFFFFFSLVTLARLAGAVGIGLAMDVLLGAGKSVHHCKTDISKPVLALALRPPYYMLRNSQPRHISTMFPV